MNLEKLSYSTELLRAVAHPLRLRLLQFIDNQGGNTVVGPIYRALDLEQSATSGHLRILREAGVIKVVQEGKFRTCYLQYDILKRVEKAVNNFLQINTTNEHETTY